MTAIIPFESNLPARRTGGRIPGLNKDVIGNNAPSFPVLSIKGKVFTLVKGKERKVITRDVDGEEEPVGSLQLSVVRANTKYRVFYAKAYNEAESDGAKPTCFSDDGISPGVGAMEPQSKKCNGCAQNVWGVRDGVGYACSVKTRLAVIDPVNMGEPFLLNVPAASRKSFAQIVEAADQRDRDYNELVMRVSFDKEAASPKLVFKPAGWLDDATFAKVQALYENDIVKDMVGVAHATPAADDVGEDEIVAAVAARKAVAAASAKPPAIKPPVVDLDDIEDVIEKPKAEPKPEPKPAKEKLKAKAAPVDDADSLLADMDALLGNKDD